MPTDLQPRRWRCPNGCVNPRPGWWGKPPFTPDHWGPPCSNCDAPLVSVPDEPDEAVTAADHAARALIVALGSGAFIGFCWLGKALLAIGVGA